MLDLSEITKRVKETPRQTTDLEVVFDVGLTVELDALRTEESGLAEQVDDLEQALTVQLEALDRDRRASDPRPAAARKAADAQRKDLNAKLEDVAARIEAVEARAVDYLVTFRFTALAGFEWAELCMRSEPREGVAIDQSRSYNVDEVARIAASRGGVRLDDDGQPVPVSSEEWAAVWESIPAFSWIDVRNHVFQVNEGAPFEAFALARAAAGKALTARKAEPPGSQLDSGSVPDGSTVGSPQKSLSTSTTTKAA